MCVVDRMKCMSRIVLITAMCWLVSLDVGLACVFVCTRVCVCVQEDFPRFVAPETEDRRPDIGRLFKMYLLPFNVKQRGEYIKIFAQRSGQGQPNEVGWTEEQYNQALQTFPDVARMAAEPLTLFMVLRVLPRLMVKPAHTTVARCPPPTLVHRHSRVIHMSLCAG